jgi:hypothetical protein
VGIQPQNCFKITSGTVTYKKEQCLITSATVLSEVMLKTFHTVQCHVHQTRTQYPCSPDASYEQITVSIASFLSRTVEATLWNGFLLVRALCCLKNASLSFCNPWHYHASWWFFNQSNSERQLTNSVPHVTLVYYHGTQEWACKTASCTICSSTFSQSHMSTAFGPSSKP